MTRRQRLAVLGATGSIGTSTLDVVARHPDRYEVVALSAQARLDELAALCRRWRPRVAVVRDAASADVLHARLHGEAAGLTILHGESALAAVAAHDEVDCVMAAIVGAAGLAPCLAAARAGKRLLLANKEAIVLGGSHFLRAVHAGGASLLPIDSEHSAIFQCLPADRASWRQCIDHIVLTASGGPFRSRDPATLADVTPEQACAHPNWSMGRKISVDSATMMNKALEVIEARWLFDLEPAAIRVVVHPQSIVHSMVVCRDASVLAQMGTPDMRVPIAYGLAWPERIASGAAALDFASMGALSFETPSRARFPCLFLAWEALAGPEGSTAVLNAANEEAVAAFLAGRIRFPDIYRVVAATLDAVVPALPEAAAVDELLALDARARAAARQRIGAAQP